jgi:hypothetical protein
MTKELQFLIYSTPQENVRVDVVVKDETVWLTQKAMAMLFGVQIPAVSKHLANIFDEGELRREATVSILEIVQPEGGRNITRNVEFYNLDAIISAGVSRVSPTGDRTRKRETVLEKLRAFFNRFADISELCASLAEIIVKCIDINKNNR